METLQEILGESYHEGMTIDEINKAVGEKNLGVIDESLTSNYEKVKNANNKMSSEIADYKRQLKAKMSEDEQRASEAKEREDEREQHIKELEREVSVSKNKASFIGLGYTEEQAEKASEAVADNDISKVLEIQKEFNANLEKAVKAEMLKGTPKPASGSNENVMTKEKFSKLGTKEQLEYVKEHPTWKSELK
jgi:Fe2+ transport system protein B